MILRRIALRHVRGIQQASFDDLSERLCLFYGPNESGKSTLVEALHFGLFESSSGRAQHKLALQTWGGNEAPEIEIAFDDDDGQTWHVDKRFVQGTHTTLHGRNVVLQGEQAEARLRELFGTRKPTNRGFSDDDLGIWPLLWIRQGRSGVATKEAITADARDVLSDTLATRTGIAAAGPIGQAVRDAVAQAYGAYFTATGQTRRPYQDVLDRAASAAAARDEAHERYLSARATADALRRAAADVADLDRRVRERQAKVAEARERATRAEQAFRALELHERDVALVRQAAEHAERDHVERRGLDAELAQARAAARAAEKAQTTAEGVFRKADDKRAALAEALEHARTRARQRARVLERVRQRAERAALAERIDQLAQRLDDAVQTEKALQAADTAVSEAGPKRDQVEALEARVAARDRARDRLEAVAARVVVTALSDVHVDGVALARGQAHEVRVTGPTALVLDDVARVEVRPGTDDAVDLRRALEQAEEQVAASCAALGVVDLADARGRLDRRREAERARDTHATRLGVLAPDGIQALREALAVLERQRAQVADDTEPLPSLAQAADDAEQAAQAQVDAEVAQRAHDGPWVEARDAVSAARATTRAADDAVAQRVGRLADLPSTEALAAKDEAARRALADALLVDNRLRAAYDAAGGHDAVLAPEAEERALAGIEQRRTQRREEVVRLEAAIDERNEVGLYDAWQDATSEAERLEEEAARERHRAEVRRVLHEAVERSWRSMRDRLAGPVQEAVAASVHILFPGSELALDDDGDVIGLRTGATVETFDQLSGGAREQFGVLVRLGLAKVIAGGRRLPVILDDALVNSDAERRDRMVEVLRKASDDLQILVFTCHDEDFDGLAAPWVAQVTGRPRRR